MFYTFVTILVFCRDIVRCNKDSRAGLEWRHCAILRCDRPIHAAAVHHELHTCARRGACCSQQAKPVYKTLLSPLVQDAEGFESIKPPNGKRHAGAYQQTVKGSAANMKFLPVAAKRLGLAVHLSCAS